MSSQKVNGTNREPESGNSPLPRRDFELLDDLKRLVDQRTNAAALLRRDLKLLDDLKRLVEQKTNAAPAHNKAAPLRNLRFDEASVSRPRVISLWPDPRPLTHGPHADENLARPAPSDQERIEATTQENDDACRSRLQSNVAEDVKPLPAGLHFLRQRPERTEVTTSGGRGRLGVLGYATLALIAAGGISFGALQLLSWRPLPNIRSEESRTTGIGGTIPAINRPVAIVLPRLWLSEVNEVEGKPVSLGISVQSPRPDSSIVIRGLPSGSFITKGSRLGRDGWRVPLQELTYAMLSPPENFAGTMTLSVDLKDGDDAVADSNVQRITWSYAETKQEPTQRANTDTNPRVASLEHEEPAKLSGNAGTVQFTAAQSVGGPGRPGAEPARPIPQRSIASLLSRANSALEIGDIVAARLLLQGAAEAGEVKAAMTLASTYDPATLRRLRTVGVQPDLAAARRWYERAAELGSIEAIERLKELR